MLSAICFNLDKSKILSSGNGLSCFYSHYVAENCLTQLCFASFVQKNMTSMSIEYNSTEHAFYLGKLANFNFIA